MAKIGDIAKISAKGSFNVLWGLVFSTIISSVGMVFIARLLGSDQYGLYTIVITVPTLIQIFRDWGVNFAIVRFTAQFRAEGRMDEIRSIFLTGILFETIVGFVLSMFTFFFADFLAINVFNRPVIAPLIQIVSFSILAGGLVAAGTAVFTGYERLELNSVMLVFQSLSKTVVIVALIVLGFSTPGAVIGYTAGTFIAGIIGIVLIGVIYRQLPKPSSCKLELKAYFTTMLTYCLPLSLANIITVLLPQFCKQGLIVHKTSHVRGSMHDYALYKHSHPYLPDRVLQYFDLGYLGIKDDYPKLNCVLPIKRKNPGRGKIGVKAEELSEEQKAFNKALSKERVVVEHTYSRVKKFRIWADEFRNRLKHYDVMTDVVSGLVNFRIAGKLII